MKLNNLKIKNTEIREKNYKLFDGGGLFLLVKKNGSKHWRYKYRFNQKEKLLTIGPYPLISLAEARERMMKAKKLLLDNIDPSLDKQKNKINSISSSKNTFQVVALEWYENRKHIWKERYARDVLKRLNEDIFPHIGKMPIKEIDSQLLLKTIRRIEERGALELAKRQLQKCGEIFRYGISSGRLKDDPSYKIAEALKPYKKKHFASIEVEELPEFINTLTSNKARLYTTTQNALWFIMLTFVRTSELINARWSEVDFESRRWTIPAGRMKRGKDHIVPLADQCISILQSQKAQVGQWQHIFPSPVKPRQAISNNTILGALSRMGYKGRMTGHGFRSLAMGAIKQELGYRHEVVDRQLAHTPKSKIDKAYDRAAFLEERTKMMQDWANYVDILSSKSVG